MGDRIVHFEIPVDDTGRSAAFFSEVFGWKTQKFGNFDYHYCITGDEQKPGINGGIMKRKHPQQPFVCTIGVENVDAAIEKISQAGGEVVVPKHAIPGVGWLAYFKDPDGNIFGITHEDRNAQ